MLLGLSFVRLYVNLTVLFKWTHLHQGLCFFQSKLCLFEKKKNYFKFFFDTVTACARLQVLNLKNLSISACDSSYMIGADTKKYSKVLVTVHAPARKPLQYLEIQKKLKLFQK